MSKIRLGCRGFRYQSWRESYYPEDLPEDWLLTYFANDFNVIMLDEADWQDAKLLEDQFDELDADLKVYGLVSSSWPTQQQIRQVEACLGEAFAGWVAQTTQPLPEDFVADAVLFNDAAADRSWAWLDKPLATSTELLLIDKMEDLPELRRLLEQVQPHLLAGSCFVLQHASPEIDWLMQTKTLLELMAIA